MIWTIYAVIVLVLCFVSLAATIGWLLGRKEGDEMIAMTIATTESLMDASNTFIGRWGTLLPVMESTIRVYADPSYYPYDGGVLAKSTAAVMNELIKDMDTYNGDARELL